MRYDTMNRRMADLLISAIEGRLNIVYSGATGAGKTTTLNVLSSYIPADERIVTLEDTAELVLQQEHVVPLEVRVANLEGKGEITMRDLFKNSLRMRPDRIIVGEVRGGEAVDMIQAMTSGHDGTQGVLHAGSPQDVIARLDVMMLSSGLRLPVWALHSQIAQALDLIIQHEQLVDGSRKITRLTEVVGEEDGQVVLQDLFTFRHLGEADNGKVVGDWECSGVVPEFVTEKMAHYRVDVPRDLFDPGTADQAFQF
jgi:pilus assembly protein CpaF